MDLVFNRKIMSPAKAIPRVFQEGQSGLRKRQLTGRYKLLKPPHRPREGSYGLALLKKALKELASVQLKLWCLITGPCPFLPRYFWEQDFPVFSQDLIGFITKTTCDESVPSREHLNSDAGFIAVTADKGFFQYSPFNHGLIPPKIRVLSCPPKLTSFPHFEFVFYHNYIGLSIHVFQSMTIKFNRFFNCGALEKFTNWLSGKKNGLAGGGTNVVEAAFSPKWGTLWPGSIQPLNL